MPKDSRLFMTFPIDFDEHPKVAPLSDAAFRAFVEMNGYSRRQSLDGRIAVATARRRWKPKALAELVASHPERPLLSIEGDEYVLRSYAEHQLTTADIEDIRTKRAEAGRKGGEARALARANAKASAKANAKQGAVANSKQSHRESESRDDLTDTTHLPESASVSIARDPANDSGELLLHAKKRALVRAEQAGIGDLEAVRDMLEVAAMERLTLGATVELAEILLARSPSPVDKADAYIATICRRTPAEVRELCTQIDVEAIA